jgi:hypothetical protein
MLLSLSGGGSGLGEPEACGNAVAVPLRRAWRSGGHQREPTGVFFLSPASAARITPPRGRRYRLRTATHMQHLLSKGKWEFPPG